MYLYLSVINSEIYIYFFIVDTCHFDSMFLSEEGFEDPWIFFDAKKGQRAKNFGKYCCMGK